MNEQNFLNDLPKDTGYQEPGVICMANASTRFLEAFFSEPLTTYATGWRDQENLQALLDFICPAVEVSRRFEYATFPNAEAFLSETDDVRAIGASFKEVEYTQSKSTGSTKNKGLTMRVDLDNVDLNSDWQNLTTARLTERLLRNEIRRALVLLSAASTNTAKTWDTSSAKDPDQDVFDESITYAGLVGLPPSNVIYDLAAWAKRFKAHRAQSSAGGFASAPVTDVNTVAALVGCQRGIVNRSFWQSGPSAKTSLMAAARVIVYMSQPNATPFDPSNIKRFVTNTVGGTRLRVYTQQVNMKTYDISVEHYSDIVMTSTLGVRQLTIS